MPAVSGISHLVRATSLIPFVCFQNELWLRLGSCEASNLASVTLAGRRGTPSQRHQAFIDRLFTESCRPARKRAEFPVAACRIGPPAAAGGVIVKRCPAADFAAPQQYPTDVTQRWRNSLKVLTPTMSSTYCRVSPSPEAGNAFRIRHGHIGPCIHGIRRDLKDHRWKTLSVAKGGCLGQFESCPTPRLGQIPHPEHTTHRGTAVPGQATGQGVSRL